MDRVSMIRDTIHNTCSVIVQLVVVCREWEFLDGTEASELCVVHTPTVLLVGQSPDKRKGASISSPFLWMGRHINGGIYEECILPLVHRPKPLVLVVRHRHFTSLTRPGL
jgi:hypothetical protein